MDGQIDPDTRRRAWQRFFVRKVQFDDRGLQASTFYSHTFSGNGGHES